MGFGVKASITAHDGLFDTVGMMGWAGGLNEGSIEASIIMLFGESSLGLVLGIGMISTGR